MSNERPSREETLMQTAELWAKRSTCIKPNGAVIAREGHIIAIGYNGAPPGHSHCLEVGCEEGPDGGCMRTLHAEANAIAMAAKYGIPTEGASMFCTCSPCPICARLIINAGISSLSYRHLYRLPQGLDLIRTSGILCTHLK